MKNFYHNLLGLLSFVFVLAGIGLLIWCGVGQFQAQLAYDGQYIQWRIIQDVSLWGFAGIPVLILGGVFFIFWGLTD